MEEGIISQIFKFSTAILNRAKNQLFKNALLNILE